MWTSEECYEVLTRGLCNLPTATRSIMGRKGGAVVCGLYSVGGFHGISKASEQFPPSDPLPESVLEGAGTWSCLDPFVCVA